MKHNQKIPESEYPAMAELALAGETASAIADLYNVSRPTVATCLRRAGLVSRGQGAQAIWIKANGQVREAEREPESDLEAKPDGSGDVLDLLREASEAVLAAQQQIAMQNTDLRVLRDANTQFAQDNNELRKEVDACKAATRQAWEQAKQDHQDALSWREYRNHRHLREVELSKQTLSDQVKALRDLTKAS